MGPHESDSTGVAAFEVVLASEGRFTTRSTAYIGSVNLVAQIADRLLVFGQIVVVAAVFGATAHADAYFLASIAPLMIGNVIGEPFGRAFLTLVVGTPGRREAVAIAAAGFWVSAAVLLGVTLVYLALALPLVALLRPSGADGLAPWLVFSAVGPAMGMAAYASGVLLWLERYAWPALRFPLASAISLCGLGLAALLSDSATWAAVGVSVGYVLGFAAMLVPLLRSLGRSLVAPPSRAAVDAVLRVRGKVAAPIAAGAVGGQVIVLAERLLGATLGAGSVALLSYARGVAAAPVVLPQAVAAGVYPGLVRAAAAQSRSYVADSFFRGLRIATTIGLAFAVYFALFGTDIIFLLLRRGIFSAASAGVAGGVLAAFALSTLAASLVVYLDAVLYGIDRFAGLLYTAGAVFLSYIVLAPVLRTLGGVEGIAIAFSVSQSLGAAVGIALVLSSLRVGVRELGTRVVLPLAPAAVALAALLGAYRIAMDSAGISAAWARAGGSAGLLLLGLAAVTLLLLPESPHLRAVLRP
jgi:peptidoglycan biosynthesis protein MviN/MurJ (putative lipid II flippase)